MPEKTDYDGLIKRELTDVERHKYLSETTMPNDDPALWMLLDGYETTPIVHSNACYICQDPDYARMGLPLCRKCPSCNGHIAADDTVCDNCGLDDHGFYMCVRENNPLDLEKCFSTGYPDYASREPLASELQAATKAYHHAVTNSAKE